MRASFLYRILFILYCVEAGTFLVLAPWSPIWDRTLIPVSFDLLRTFSLHPVVRAAVTGFGLIHLVWGAHDLDELIFRRKVRATDV
ncbi:MAG TPA: hypothetical protein VHC97_15030 [Thermoanaerobaculia bacterium]|jgi:hypothetical protein|nr:hypothetical protein [Thermoanaerobaculia bacterium]